MAKKKIPFLRPGKFTAMNGKEVTIDESTLDTIIEATKNFAYQDDDFPLVIGHPKTDSPAYGWINKNNIVKEGDVLVALAEDENLVPEMKDWFGKKLYKKVSVKLRPDFSIAHIGFLGANPPAVTGLPAVALSENDNGFEIEFAELELSPWYFRNVSRIFRRIKNYIIEKDGLEKADALISEYEIDEINTPPRVWEKETARNFSEDEKNNSTINFNEEEMKTLQELQDQVTELSAKITAQQAEITSLTTEKTAVVNEANSLKAQQKRNAFLAFCESDEVKNKIKDGEKAELVETLLALDAVEAFEFGEGDEKKTISPVETVKGLLKRLPDVVALGEHANNHTAGDDLSDVDVSEFAEKNVDPESLELHKKVLALSKKENIGYAEALNRVRSKK